jgi:hypothetical protein
MQFWNSSGLIWRHTIHAGWHWSNLITFKKNIKSHVSRIRPFLLKSNPIPNKHVDCIFFLHNVGVEISFEIDFEGLGKDERDQTLSPESTPSIHIASHIVHITRFANCLPENTDTSLDWPSSVIVHFFPSDENVQNKQGHSIISASSLISLYAHSVSSSIYCIYRLFSCGVYDEECPDAWEMSIYEEGVNGPRRAP